MATDITTLAIEVKNKQAVSAMKEFNSTLDRGSFSAIQLAKDIAAIYAGSKLFQFAKQATSEFIQMEEAAFKFDVTFSRVADKAQKKAEELTDVYGLASVNAKSMLADTGDLLMGLGFAAEEALELAERTAKLGIDLKSFNNYWGTAADATFALTKAMLGETEAAKALGVAIKTDSAEYKKRYKDLVENKNMTEMQAKAYLALEMAYEQSGNAIGDYLRPGETLAQVQAQINESLTQTKALIGEGLAGPTRVLMVAMRDLLDIFKKLSPATRSVIINLSALTAATVAFRTATSLLNTYKLMQIKLEGDVVAGQIKEAAATTANTKAISAQAAALTARNAAAKLGADNISINYLSGDQFRREDIMARWNSRQAERGKKLLQQEDMAAYMNTMGSGTGLFRGRSADALKKTFPKLGDQKLSPEVSDLVKSFNAASRESNVFSKSINTLKATLKDSSAINKTGNIFKKSWEAINRFGKTAEWTGKNTIYVANQTGIFGKAIGGAGDAMIGCARSAAGMAKGLVASAVGMGSLAAVAAAILLPLDALQSLIRGKGLEGTMVLQPLADSLYSLWDDSAEKAQEQADKMQEHFDRIKSSDAEAARLRQEINAMREDAMKAEMTDTERLAYTKDQLQKSYESSQQIKVDYEQQKKNAENALQSLLSQNRNVRDESRRAELQEKIQAARERIHNIDTEFAEKEKQNLEQQFKQQDEIKSLQEKIRSTIESAQSMQYELQLGKANPLQRMGMLNERMNTIWQQTFQASAEGNNEEAISKLQEIRSLNEQITDEQMKGSQEVLNQVKMITQTAQQSIEANTMEARRLQSRMINQQQNLIAETSKKTAENTAKSNQTLIQIYNALQKISNGQRIFGFEEINYPTSLG